MISRTSLVILASTGAGRARATHRPYQDDTWIAGKPASPVVCTSGNQGARVVCAMATA